MIRIFKKIIKLFQLPLISYHGLSSQEQYWYIIIKKYSHQYNIIEARFINIFEERLSNQ